MAKKKKKKKFPRLTVYGDGNTFYVGDQGFQRDVGNSVRKEDETQDKEVPHKLPQNPKGWWKRLRGWIGLTMSGINIGGD